jgi:hypothetical protein
VGGLAVQAGALRAWNLWFPRSYYPDLGTQFSDAIGREQLPNRIMGGRNTVLVMDIYIDTKLWNELYDQCVDPDSLVASLAVWSEENCLLH